MDYYGDHVCEEDSYNRQSQEHRKLSSECGVETLDDFNNSRISDIGGSQMNHSVDLPDSSFGKLFVGGLSWETTEETFADYFTKFGELSDSVIMTDKHSGRPRGFGFVTFADTSVAVRVLEDDHIIDGRKVELKRTVPRQEMEFKGISKTKKIFVGGLPSSLAEDELKEYFSFYGNIVEHQIMYDHKTGRSRGFGFVTFQTEESVGRIFSEGKIHELGGKQVEIKTAEPKRAGRDYNANAFKPYSSRSAGGRYGHEDMYDGKTNGNYSGYGGYDGYGAYGGNYMGDSAGFYGCYGGFGYSYGFGSHMYGVGYASSGYGNIGGYSAVNGYTGGKGYGNVAVNGENFNDGKGSGTSGSLASRYHPYQK